MSLATCTAVAETAPDVAAYAFPADAIKVEGPPDDHRRYEFFARGPNGERGERLGLESYYRGGLTSRELRRGGQLHGVQRVPQGPVHSDEPYRDGVREGTFRHWDEG